MYYIISFTLKFYNGKKLVKVSEIQFYTKFSFLFRQLQDFHKQNYCCIISITLEIFINYYSFKHIRLL